jgi:hypothetical protein
MKQEKYYTKLEIEAIDFLKSVNIRTPKTYMVEEFDKIYHDLFGIYTDLHYSYLYFKYGRDTAKRVVWIENMEKVSEFFHSRCKDFENGVFAKTDFNPFGA